jgi:ribosomal protein S18 acetylase RimI-like enzyme
MLIREIDKTSESELKIVTERCMLAVLETIPEFNNSEVIARASLPNFSHEQMSAMIERDLSDDSKRIMVATDGEMIIGQALYSSKIDDAGTAYGSFFNAYVIPELRRKGVAMTLMQDALRWFAESRLSYAIAQTHVTNAKVLALADRLGFAALGPHKGAWEYFTLRKELAVPPQR